MKKAISLLTLLAALATLAIAQGPAYPYSVVLTWTAPAGTAPASYNIYRATYSASACGTYATISTAGAVTATTYTDSTVSSGAQYCYEVTAVSAAGAESGPDVLATNPVSLPPAPPTSLAATVK